MSHIDASLLILAGGSGSRMGGNKLFLSIDGLPLLERLALRLEGVFAETVLAVGVGESDLLRGLLKPLVEVCGPRIVEDRERGRGPLEGLRQGLSAMSCEWGFLLGVDMPDVQEAVVRQMWALTPRNADVAAVCMNGRLTALHAFYKKSCLPYIDAAIEDGERTKRGGAKIMAFYDQVDVRRIDEKKLAHLPGYRRSFDNYNTWEELRELR